MTTQINAFELTDVWASIVGSKSHATLTVPSDDSSVLAVPSWDPLVECCNRERVICRPFGIFSEPESSLPNYVFKPALYVEINSMYLRQKKMFCEVYDTDDPTK